MERRLRERIDNLDLAAGDPDGQAVVAVEEAVDDAAAELVRSTES